MIHIIAICIPYSPIPESPSRHPSVPESRRQQQARDPSEQYARGTPLVTGAVPRRVSCVRSRNAFSMKSNKITPLAFYRLLHKPNFASPSGVLLGKFVYASCQILSRSLASTSTEADRMMRSMDKTTRSVLFLRTRIPSTPTSGPRLILTRRPTVK